VKIVHPWLAELVEIPADPERVASEISLRGFEVASVEGGRLPVIDFEITANRPDCLNHVGIAREAAVIWNVPLRLPHLAQLETSGASEVSVAVEDAELCPRYCAQVFEVRIGPSPAWLAERLEAAGVRPISNIVDVTNYVMLEMGQPMHAFDMTRLAAGRIVVRRAKPGERVRTLDGVERTLEADMLVIAEGDGEGRATAVAGVMGGAESEISSATTRIALESAHFSAPAVRRSSKQLGLKTEASIRFERGSDPDAPPAGIARVAALLEKIGAGTAVGPLVDRYRPARRDVTVPLRSARIARLLGQEVPAADVPRILQPLGFGVTATGNGAWRVTVPSFRVDVSREADLIEEVGRHYGFDRIPPTFPALTAPQPPLDPAIARDRLARQVLAAAGFSEAMTFVFIERDAALPFGENGVEPAAIANPLSEKFAVLRPSLLPGLLDACVHNRRRSRRDIRLFEAGSRYTAAGEGRAAAFALTGAAEPPHWSGAERLADFFDVKGVAELICRAFGVAPDVVHAERPYLVRGRTAELRIGTEVLGVIGQLAPAIASARGFPQGEEVYAGEIDMSALAAAAHGGELRAESLPRFPSIVRDISILVDDTLPAASVRGTIRAAASPLLVSVVEFDRYQGTGIPEGRASLSLRLTFRAPDRTLTDAEAQEAADFIVAALRERHGAQQR
jgi:phenylalanyl-tRNA synthetase beta chain